MNIPPIIDDFRLLKSSPLIKSFLKNPVEGGSRNRPIRFLGLGQNQLFTISFLRPTFNSCLQSSEPVLTYLQSCRKADGSREAIVLRLAYRVSTHRENFAGWSLPPALTNTYQTRMFFWVLVDYGHQESGIRAITSCVLPSSLVCRQSFQEEMAFKGRSLSAPWPTFIPWETPRDLPRHKKAPRLLAETTAFIPAPISLSAKYIIFHVWAISWILWMGSKPAPVNHGAFAY